MNMNMIHYEYRYDFTVKKNLSFIVDLSTTSQNFVANV